MLSRRKFLAISSIMAVLFFMFQFSNVIKDRWNDYGTNEYERPVAEATGNEAPSKAFAGERPVIYIGDVEHTKTGRVVAEWAGYSKRELTVYEGLAAYQSEHPLANVAAASESRPDTQALILDSAYLDFSKDTQALSELARQGVNLIFCNLPTLSVIEENEQLRDLLGITYIREKEVRLMGTHLFGGFLLGGATKYIATDEEEEKKQDLDLTIPWYIIHSGSKSYMVGLLEDEAVENELLPNIIWRTSVGDAKVFVVNGDYMEDSMGIGILSAFLYELHDYELYPVVNAQNMVIANYPGLASENNEKMQELYNRTQEEVFRDIAWPSIAAISEKSGMYLSCMLAPQFDYGDGQLPDAKELTYYLKLMKERKAEAGLSTSQVSSVPLEEKLKEDQEFLSQNVQGYTFQSLYADGEEVYPLLGGGLLKDISTIVTEYGSDRPILSYATEDVTLQNATVGGFQHTFSEDIRVRSLETALAYSNIVADMELLAYPRGQEDSWEKMFDEFSSNTNTYWKNFTMFEPTVLSESDARIRNFMALDYECEREGDQISLKIENLNGEAWFILRTHGEEIQKVEGASYQEIEKDAYLLRIQKPKAKITLKSDIRLHYSAG